MAYTPTLQDIPQEQGGYTPTLSDLPNESSPSLLSQAVTNVAPINVGGARFGGNLISDAGTILQKLGAQRVGQAFSKFGNEAIQNAPQFYGMQDPSLRQNMIANVAQFAPYAIAPEIKALDYAASIPIAGKLLAPAAVKAAQMGALYGATQSDQGNALSDATAGAIGGLALGNIPAAYQGYKSAKSFLTGSDVKDAASNLYQTISGNLSKDDLNEQNVKNIVGNYIEKKTDLGNQYEDLKSQAQSRGYAQSGKPSTFNYIAPSVPSVGKFINPSDNTSNLFDSLGQGSTQDNSIKNISKVLKDKIAGFNKSPTYENAHNLQSALGEESADFTSSANADQSDKSTAAMLTQARKSLLDDITSNFKSNGDTDLADQYQNLRNLWRQNVAPYQNVPSIWRAIRGKNIPTNVINTLDDDDLGGNNQVIRNHLMKNQNQSQSVMAQALQKAATKDANGNYSADPKNLLDSYNNLADNIQQFAQPASLADKLGQLQSMQDNYLKYAPPINSTLGYLAKGSVLGAATGLGFHYFRNG